MKGKYAVLVGGLLCLGMLIAGCGGGGGGSDLTPGVSLVIGADTGAGVIPMSRAVSLSSPLADGADVVVRSFQTGSELARGKLSGGFCTLSVAPGMTVVVVVTGNGADGKPYRLSRIIPLVPLATPEEPYVATPATTVAAEAIGEIFYKKIAALDSATVEAVETAANAFVLAHSGADFSVGGGIVAGTDFALPGSLTDAAQAVKDAVPDTIDDKLVLAKNAVQQIKEAGVPLEAMLSQEPVDIEAIFTEAVLNKYDALASNLGRLIGPLLFSDVEYGGDPQVGLFDLTPGHKYVATFVIPGSSELTLSDDGTTDPNKILVTLAADGGTYTVTATKNATSWTVTQTFSEDSSQVYTVTIPDASSLPETNPTITGSFNLADSNFATPIHFTGTVRATGADLDHYTQVTFEGNLSGPQVTARGTFQASFPAAKPAGALPEETIYDFPTSFSMTNASISATNGSGTTMTLAGSITGSTQVVTVEGHPNVVPKQITIEGTYGNTHSGLNFDGTIAANWSNPSASAAPNTVSGSLSMEGSLIRDGHPTYLADISINLNNGAASTEISLRVGAATLSGSGSGTVNSEGDIVNGSLTLTNQDGVVFNVRSGASGEFLPGTVKVQSVTQATITREVILGSEVLKVTYTDSTFDTF